MSDDLFGDDNTNDNKPTIDPNKNYLDELVGDGKKFSDAVSLARAKMESDFFVDKLQEENKAMRDQLSQFQNELQTRNSVEENIQKFMDKINNDPSAQRDSGQNGNNQNPDGNGSGDNKETSGISLDDVQTLLEERDTRSKKEQNLSRTQSELQKMYGDSWKTASSQRLEQLNISKDYANQMAAEQPDAFVALMKPEKSQSSPNLFLEGDVDSPANAGDPARNNGGGMTWEQLQQLRKDDPAAYWKPRVQNYIHKMAMEKGNDFMK